MSLRRQILAVSGLCCICAPAYGEVTSSFGIRNDPFHGRSRMHSGMDMAAPVGTPVYATGDGIVRRARVAGGYGNLVEIEHGFEYQSRFAHMSRILVGEGQFVRRGTMIGLVGSTGRSTGPHLHYEVRIRGKAVDPSRFMQIVFAAQPDWSAVQASLSARERSRPVQLAHAGEQKSTGRVGGDLEIDFGSLGRRNSDGARGRMISGFAAGHTRFDR